MTEGQSSQKLNAPISRRKLLLASGAAAGISLIAAGCSSASRRLDGQIYWDDQTYGEENRMGEKVLVVYASRTGSTAGVADAIARTLAAKGSQVDVKPMTEVTDLSQYRAVVAGSAIRGQKWLPEAMDFLNANKLELARKPFADFMVCITLAMKNGESYREGVKDWMAPVRRTVKPFSEGYFAGALDLSKLSGMDKVKMGLAASLGVFPKGDHRDWKAIETWADGIAGSL
jgi:menaquinone-dependent protoporphyrinogen oxidase